MNIIAWITVVCLPTLLIWTHCSADTPVNPRIIGGTLTTIDNVPYIVNLRVRGVFSCGGTLVTRQHVVTAAHCVKGERVSSLRVVGGATNISDRNGVERSVERAFTPKDYSAITYNMDVAVLKLAAPLIGTNIETIALCNSTMRVGDYVQVSGWGQTSEKSATTSNGLRTVRVKILSKLSCTQQYKNRAALTKSMFCASVAGTKDSCAGDSGGPAIYNDQLCGIVSWGVGCARKNSPGVYTKVQAVNEFIRKAIAAS